MAQHFRKVEENCEIWNSICAFFFPQERNKANGCSRRKTMCKNCSPLFKRVNSWKKEKQGIPFEVDTIYKKGGQSLFEGYRKSQNCLPLKIWQKVSNVYSFLLNYYKSDPAWRRSMPQNFSLCSLQVKRW